MDREFIIDGRTLDFGTEGRFAPGSENKLRALLKKKGQKGEDMFNRLVAKGQIKFVEEKKAPKLPKDVETKSEEPEPKDEDSEAGDEDDDLIFEATGKYEFHPYGGGNCHIADPDGKVIDSIRGHKKAEKRVEELNK